MNQQHQTTRVRLEARRRTAIVEAVIPLSPRMRRFVFKSEDLKDFTSPSPDDHVKLFFPDAPRASESDKPTMRDFTPQSFDNATGRLTIDFALHDSGPASDWARTAKVGDRLEVGGPRGSSVIPDDFDWWVMIGDETAAPSILRRLDELGPATKAFAWLIVDDAAEEAAYSAPPGRSLRWVHRRQGAEDAVVVLSALDGFTPPAGDGFIWVAAEAATARALRSHLLPGLGPPAGLDESRRLLEAGRTRRSGGHFRLRPLEPGRRSPGFRGAADQGVDTERPGAGDAQVQEDEAEQNGEIPAVDDGKEAARHVQAYGNMHREIGDRHLAR